MRGLSRRRSLLALTSCLVAPAILPPRGHAQSTLPDRPLRILVGFAAGGGAELMARVIAPALERRVGRRVTVQNKPSGTDIAAGNLFKDDLQQGLVVAFLPSTTLSLKLPSSPFPFDSASGLVPLTTAGAFQVAFAVSPMTGAASFAEYIAWVKAGSPGRARLATTSTDAYLRIYGRMIGRDIGVPFEIVPDRGASGLAKSLMAGVVPAGLGSVATLLQQKRARQVTIVMTSGHKRVRVLRDVPTVVELGYSNLELQEWYGFFASSSSPRPAVAEWDRQLRAVLAQDEVVADLSQLGLEVEASTAAETAARFEQHQQVWQQRMASFGMKSDN